MTIHCGAAAQRGDWDRHQQHSVGIGTGIRHGCWAETATKNVDCSSASVEIRVCQSEYVNVEEKQVEVLTECILIDNEFASV